MKAIQQNPHVIDSLSSILNILRVIDLCLILFNTSRGIHSIPRESNYISLFWSINKETQCVPLPFLSSRFMAYAPCFILGKLCLKETPLSLGS